MNLELAGKKVLITGASQGIGLAIAKGFLEEKAKTCIVSRGSNQLYENEQELQKKYSAENIFAMNCDCTNVKSINELQKEVGIRWKNLDIVIINVGNGQSVPSALPDADEWQRTWKNNFESALETARVFLPMLEKSKGVLVFISSIAGMEAFGAPTDYSTAKAAIIALSKNLARKLAPNVRVNVVAPGNVYFKGGTWDEKIKNNKKHIDEIIKANVPMKRFAAPEEIADSVLFLCSARAKFITGSTLVIDGGQTVGIT